MGKKYIIELEDKPFHKEDGDFLYRVKGFNSLVFDLTGVSKLTPYTEPDLEQVRKEAYDKGYDDAAEEIGSDEQAIADKAYKNGLSDAWEAARKIAVIPYGEVEKIFGATGWHIFMKCAVSEVIEKLKAYEQDAEIKVGDEVINRDKKAVVTEITDRFVRIMYSDGGGYALFSEDMTKTGRHFPEIAAVLQKMKEASDG